MCNSTMCPYNKTGIGFDFMCDCKPNGQKVKYKKNYYKFSKGNWFVMGGENNLYLSRVKDEKMVGELDLLLEGMSN